MTTDSTQPHARHPLGRGRPAIKAAILVAVLAIGAAGGVAGTRYIHGGYPHSVLLLQPTPIAQVRKDGPVALKGQVAEIYGGKFILQDASGRTLVDTGPRGDSNPPVTKDESVTVQGYFAHGFLHANVLIGADGTTEAFGPPGPPPWHGHRPGHGPGPGPGPGHAPPPAP
ncbi:MAG TPA: hypothetical protein VNF99_07900 [Stellaceae bacterium]|nr:hypothetical protein [Stellaceae bacterium]